MRGDQRQVLLKLYFEAKNWGRSGARTYGILTLLLSWPTAYQYTAGQQCREAFKTANPAAHGTKADR